MKKKIKIATAIFSVSFSFLFLLIIIISVATASIAASFAMSKKSQKIPSDLPPILTYEIIRESVISYEKYKVPAGITLAQVVLESSGSYPKPDGHFSYLAWEHKNLFGMKGSGSQGSANLQTSEQEKSGKIFQTKAKFAKYKNFAESIDEHGKLLSRPMYLSRVRNIESSASWADGLQGLYATNLDYSAKLKSIMEKYNLYRFDGITLAQLPKVLKEQGELSGDEQNLNDIQSRILSSAKKGRFSDPWHSGYKNYCERFCRHIYEDAGLKYHRSCCAANNRDTLAIKKDKIPVGALIYASNKYKSGVRCSTCGRDAGHVAIYIGGGKVLGSQPKAISSLSDWIKYYGYGGYSFGGNRVKEY